MAEIELVIKIPEEVKIAFDCAESNDLKGCYYDHGGIIGNAIKNGTPLLEPHGRLIDADDLDITTITTDDYSGNEVLDIVLKEDVDNAPTIIPAIEEKSCATCGQPRNYTGDCILFMERKCVARYEKWKPATEEEKSCLDCSYYPNTSACESCEGYSNYINGYIPKEGDGE